MDKRELAEYDAPQLSIRCPECIPIHLNLYDQRKVPNLETFMYIVVILSAIFDTAIPYFFYYKAGFFFLLKQSQKSRSIL